jgi:glycosyltransferase involved in cell wall biosynthesis
MLSLKNKTVLVSAYACEPNKGSENEVGWRWILDISKEAKEVIVVTRANNKDNIEKELLRKPLKNVQFLYFDLPYILRFYKKGKRGIYLYSYLWEIGVFFFLLSRYKKSYFDISQRLTFVSYKFPTFIWYFSKQFILGPIAGGERYPVGLLKIFSFRGKIKEVLRMILQRVVLYDPFIFLTMKKADKIIAVTDETKSILFKKFQKKTIIKPAIQIDKNDFKVDVDIEAINKNNDYKIKLLYVGRLLELKGLMFILKALKEIDNSKYILTVIGDGSDRKIFENYVQKYNLNVEFLGNIPRQKLSKYYLNADLFVFPSLHDSGGMVVLEAKAHGLKVLVSAYGGPKMFIDNGDFVVKGDSVWKMIDKIKGIIKNEIS